MRIIEQNLIDSISIRNGTIKDVEINLFSIVKNEEYFICAFFDHYRKLGVEQFLILDDNSSDNTRKILNAQKDCVVLTSTFSFGDEVCLVSGHEDIGAPLKADRAGRLLKASIGKKFLMGKYAIYADADEFLILPERIKDLAELIKKLRTNNVDAVAASVVELYPEKTDDMKMGKKVNSLDDLLKFNPYFDAVPVITLAKDGAKKTGQSASARLFRKYNVKQIPEAISWVPEWIESLLGYNIEKSPVLKTPLINWSSGVYMVGSHNANVPASSEICLAIMHFKFTNDFAKRYQNAIKFKGHRNKGEKYRNYNRLYSRLQKNDGLLIDSLSEKYLSTDSFERYGIIKCNLLK